MSKALAALGGLLLAALVGTASAQAPKVLFVGNSFTYTRPPALQYNTANVADLTAGLPGERDPLLPQPWGGVPGIFKALADQAGLEFDVRHSLRGGATLRGHMLNTNPAGWDLRANLALEKWDIVVLQGNSTEAVNRAGGDFGQFDAYVGKLKRFLTVGDAHSYRERDLYPGGNSTLRNLPANPNANPQARLYLYQTWTRPDLTYPAGAPYAGEPIETMAEDLRRAYGQAAINHGGFAGVVPVGEAFVRAVQEGFAQRNPYEPEPRLFDLWWYEDQFHPSAYGAYLSALTFFGAITGIDPASFGANEKAAGDLGIRALRALQLQRVASAQLLASGYPLRTLACLHASPKAAGAQPCTR